MKFTRLAIPEVILVEPRRHADERGWFVEAWKASAFCEAGIEENFVQDNTAMSYAASTIRGLHFQIAPLAQAKLVRCRAGVVFDVAVDLRRCSPTFGCHVSMELSAANGLQVYIPEGFAHGYCTLTPGAVVDYKVSQPYDPVAERGLAWNDPTVGISWPLGDREPVLSPRDRNLPRLNEISEFF